MSPRLAYLTAVLCLAASGCARPPAEPAPPEIDYGQDVCDACGMIISEARFAAGAALADGTALKFDDIGDMLRYRTDHVDLPVAAWFVHDYVSETWLNAAEATFVIGSRLATPMGHGVAAFSDPSEARAFAETFEGAVLTWDQVGQHFSDG